jgi:hypothetical protein
MPNWYTAGIVAAILGVLITPALALIFTIHAGLGKGIAIFKQVLSAIITILIVVATAVVIIISTNDMSETELNWWMQAFGLAAALEIVVGEQVKIAIKYAIYKFTSNKSPLGKFVRES